MERKTVSPANFDVEIDPQWIVTTAVAPSSFGGANGIRFGRDGLLYVAQFLSSSIDAIDPANGAERVLERNVSGFVAPDDMDFDDDGVMYVTEVMDGRVSAQMPNGEIRLLAADLPGVNGIACHRGRLFVDEFRPGGRVLELYSDRAPRVIVENVPLPNALCVGPDDFVYYPAVAAGQVWRVHPDRGQPELFCDGLAMPTSVKVAPQGNLVVTEAATGRICRIDLSTRAMVSVAQVRPGLDNCAYDENGGLFVSHFIDGGIAEILSDGSAREVVAPGLLGPWDVSVDGRGILYVADGMRLLAVDREGRHTLLASYLSHGFPGFLRNVVAQEDGSFIVSTSAGVIAHYRTGGETTVLASGLDQVAGLAIGPDGCVLAAESGTGRLLSLHGSRVSVVAAGLGRPMGVASIPGGGYIVSDAKGGRLLEVGPDGVRSIATGLRQPQGVVIHRGRCYVIDRGARTLLEVSASGTLKVIAARLPIGGRGGLHERVLPGTETLPGPLIAYSGIAVRAEGAFVIACDGDGSVLELYPRLAP